jgi:hypothetical protein
MKKRAGKPRPRNKQVPAVVYFWSFGLALIGYVAARVVLDGQPHPYHWGGGLVGGLAGVPAGWLWYFRRGDVF